MMNMEKGSVDFAIVTALKVERDAMLGRLAGVTIVQEDSDPHTYYCSRLDIPGTDQVYGVVVTMLLEPGNDSAATTVTHLIQRWQPRYVLMVGIAGGVRGKVSLGDVVVADFIHYYEPAKLTPTGEERRPQQFRTDRVLYGRALAYEANDWKTSIGVSPPRDAGPDHLPAAHFGGIASGEKVVADDVSLSRLLKEAKLLAVAMEGAGVARAAERTDLPLGFLEIRSISDYGDSQKNDDWHGYAANAAAAFTIGLLRSRPVKPGHVTGLESETTQPPLMALCAQSLRRIGRDELRRSMIPNDAVRLTEVISLDFTNLVDQEVFLDPLAAVQRLVDSDGALVKALARLDEAELVFHGLVHVPLAILAGYLVTDRQPVRLFDFHPDPALNTWAWPESGQAFPHMTVHGIGSLDSIEPTSRIVVLRMSVSYRVLPEQTRIIVPRATEIDLTLPEPQRSIVQSERQVLEYGRVLRQTLDLIVQRLPSIERVHLFYAGPVALAFHVGQQISPNIHPPVTAWNFHRGYDWAIDLAQAVSGTEPIQWAPKL